MKDFVPMADGDGPCFRGERGGFELPRVKVTLDGAPLPLRLDLWNHSPDGFEWGYTGSGPAQLALAMLAAVAGDDEFASAMHQAFKRDVVQHLAADTWTYSVANVRAWIVARRSAMPPFDQFGTAGESAEV